MDSINIDRNNDELTIRLRIYSPETYDPINRRKVFTQGVIELILQNESSERLELNNPILSIYESGLFATRVTRYMSSELAEKCPKELAPAATMSLLYDARHLEALLQDYYDETLLFHIMASNGVIYSSIELNGKNIEDIIAHATKDAFWPTPKTYSFDQKLDD